MPAEMPTRRARRPDGQYYRNTRRARLADGARGGGTFSPFVWGDVLAVSVVALIALFLLRWLGPATWTFVTPLIYVALLAAVVSAVALWRALRG
jgi:hypothetical protein